MSYTSWAIALIAPLPFWLAYAALQALALRQRGGGLGRWMLPFAIAAPLGVALFQAEFYALTSLGNFDVLQNIRDAVIVLVCCFLSLVVVATLAHWLLLRSIVAYAWAWAAGLGLLAMITFFASAIGGLQLARQQQLIVLGLTALAGATAGTLSGVLLRVAPPAVRNEVSNAATEDI